MSESFPKRIENIKTVEKEKLIALAIEVSENNEIFPFPGIDPEAYKEIKKDEDPDYHTPIDELVERFKNEGVKVVLTKHSQSGNVLILPAQSDDIVYDSLFPRHLQISESMNDSLRELILLQQKLNPQQKSS
jgi:hypothetical protein